MSVWFDVRMNDKSEAAMEEGVKNSKYFVAVITGPCVNNDRPNDPQDGNAYFRRPYCIKEILWAQEAGKHIQPILRIEDKGRIGEYLGLLDAPLKIDGHMQDLTNLKCLGSTDWIDLNRNNKRYWDVGMDMVCEALEAGEEKAAKSRQQNVNSSGERKEISSTGSTSSIDRAALEKEIEERLRKEMKQETTNVDLDVDLDMDVDKLIQMVADENGLSVYSTGEHKNGNNIITDDNFLPLPPTFYSGTWVKKGSNPKESLILTPTGIIHKNSIHEDKTIPFQMNDSRGGFTIHWAEDDGALGVFERLDNEWMKETCPGYEDVCMWQLQGLKQSLTEWLISINISVEMRQNITKEVDIVDALNKIGVEMPEDLLELDLDEITKFISDANLNKIEGKRFLKGYEALVVAAGVQ